MLRRLFSVAILLHWAASIPLCIDWSNEKPEELDFSTFRVQIVAENGSGQWNVTVLGNVSRLEFDTPLGANQLHRVQVWAESDSDLELLIADKFITAGSHKTNKSEETTGASLNAPGPGQPQNLQFTKEGLQLRIGWDKPTVAQCSNYLVNYTITTLSTPKSFALDVQYSYALIKFLKGHLLKVQIYCVSEESVVGDAPLEGYADLRVPQPVQSFKVTNLETDEFFRSKVSVSFDTSGAENENVDFTIIFSYFQGKAQKTRKDITWHGESMPINISSLVPTEQYTFQVYNMSRYELISPVKTIRQFMPPIISSSIYPGKTTSKSMWVHFSPTDVDQAKFDSYLFQFGFNHDINFTATADRIEPKNSFYFDDLTPGETYLATLYTVFKGNLSRPVTANFTTYPLKIKNLLPIVRRDSIKIFWEPEDLLPGIQYKLQLTGSDGFESPVIVTSETNYLFTHLKPEIWYTVDITVVVSDTESESESRTVVTGFNKPRFPILDYVGATKVTISIDRDIITESNGALTSHAVIIAENTKLDTYNYVLPSWYEVQNSEVWPPYQATGRNYDPFRSRKENSVTIPIGTEDCRLHTETFCNGPLKPLTQYQLKIRACTKEEICMETEYTKFTTFSEEMLNIKSGSCKKDRRLHLLVFLLVFFPLCTMHT